MSTLWQDITYGCRMLFSKPGFTVAAILSLALGIGANTTIFSIINATLLGTLPYENPDSLMVLWSSSLQNPDNRNAVTGQQYFAWKDGTQTLSSVGGWYGFANNLAGDPTSPAESVQTGKFTYSMWDVLGVKPMLGRVFTEDEDQNGNPAPVAVLSHEFWQRRFGGVPNIVGQTMMVDGVLTTIIGVMPEGFLFANSTTAFWTPMGFTPQQLNSAASFLLVVGRLRDGATQEQVQAELESISTGLREQFPERNADRAVLVEDMPSAFTQGLAEPLLVLQGAVIFVLLIACSNVAGLLLARAAARRTEVTVRTALGASRGRIVRQLLTESLLLAASGGVLGAFLGWLGLRLVISQIPVNLLPGDITDIGVSSTVLGYTAAVSIITGLIFGVVPALQTSKVDLATTLKESGRTGMDGAGRQRVRQILVTAQIALALILLIGAGLMMNTFMKLQANNLGANPANLLTFEFRFAQAEMMRPVSTFRGVGLWEMFPITGLTWNRVHERIKSIPGVVSAAGISRPPLTGTMGMNFTILGQTNDEERSASYYAITPEYFSTMEIPLLQGRDFTATDSTGAPLVVIVSKAMADRWWPNQSPLGQFITLDFVPDEVPRQIVGVVGDTLQSRFQQQPQPTVYVPHVQQTTHWQGPSWNMRAAMYFVMRTAGEPGSVADEMRQALTEIDSTRPAGLVRTVEEYLSDQLSEVRVFMMLLGIFGVSAAVLAATGIYGVMAYAVAQRTREIGIRVALGANASNVIRLVVRQALFVVAIGMVVGIAGAFALTRFLTNFLWQVSPTDPVTFLSVSIGLVLIAVLACLVPTRRAITVAPTEALRHE